MTLPPALRREAAQWADRQGVSLDEFVLRSVAEKVGELRRGVDDPDFPGIGYRWGASGQPTPIVRGTGIRVQTIVTAAQHWGLPSAQIAAEYGLSETQVEECLAFFAAHREEIDSRIQTEEVRR